MIASIICHGISKKCVNVDSFDDIFDTELLDPYGIYARLGAQLFERLVSLGIMGA